MVRRLEYKGRGDEEKDMQEERCTYSTHRRDNGMGSGFVAACLGLHEVGVDPRTSEL